MRLTPLLVIASACALAAAPALAQGGPHASTVGAKASRGGSTVGGTAGSAAAGGTSASTVGLGASSTGRTGTSAAVGGAGSAAAAHGRATSRTRIHQNPQMLRSQSMARAHDGGTWSHSMTHTSVGHGNVRSWTRSMAHQPGGKPAMSTTRVR
jgi:hypothetical protein